MLEVYSLESEQQRNSRRGIDQIIKDITDPDTLDSARGAITSLAQNKKTGRDYPRDIAKLVQKSPWLKTGFGSYFATVAGMKTTYGPRVMDYVNPTFGFYDGAQPIQVGSGVGCIEPFEGALKLLNIGSRNPNRITQYDSPGGIYADRIAAALLLNDKIAPGVVDSANDKNLFGLRDVYITPGATNALNVAFEAWERFCKDQMIDNGVCVLGPAYYMTAMGAWDKDIAVERLIEERTDLEGVTKMLPTTKYLKENVSPGSNLLVITSPNNPNGEMYSEEEMRELLKFIQKNNKYLLVDSVFDQMIFENSEQTPSVLALAQELNILERIIVVDGLSKNINVAGERIGFIGTKNPEIERQINRIMITSLSNPSLTIGPLLQFEAAARLANYRNRNLYKDNLLATQLTAALVNNELQSAYGASFLEGVDTITFLDQRNSWVRSSQNLYESLLRVIGGTLREINRSSSRSPDSAAYNTFIGFESLGDNQGLDKIIKMFTTTGVVPMGSECFGRRNPKDEFWTRITYGGLRRDLLATALTRIIAFFDVWEDLDMGNPNKFPVFNQEIPLI
ncbi:aminotransferase class I/II-fold pyridoxal phosphate-dependent enzyme [Candidatus Dojkabacteria bacterium]|nr:aminotransferase class I/II-fold pyridoxal phosphate-dependent enzyme [Candidatus Dojkabacteria bacterium]